MKLYIMRHGETTWNQRKCLQGQTDISLNESGIRLAQLTGERLKSIPFDYVITSPLDRAKQTAKLAIANREIPIIEDDRIKEMSFGDWEGECILDSSKISPEFTDKFYHDPLHLECPPNGETFADVCARTKDFYQSLLTNTHYQNATILISSHGAASRCLLTNFYEDQNDIWRGCVPPNCAITIVDVCDGISTIVEQDKLYY